MGLSRFQLSDNFFISLPKENLSFPGDLFYRLDGFLFPPLWSTLSTLVERSSHLGGSLFPLGWKDEKTGGKDFFFE